MSAAPYVLKFSHKIIEHLGIKLYQNKPTNVIAELVSNSWDAEAHNVWIDISGEDAERRVVVADDGSGMSPDVLRTSYLVIGKPKRGKDSPDETTPKLARRPMGRKGIGKLAPFGIASEIHLLSIVKADDGARAATWLRFDVAKMRALEDEADEDLAIYEPEVICSEAPVSDLTGLAKARGYSYFVDGFVDRIGGGAGTLVAMTKLSTRRAIDPVAVGESMGRRFTVTLLRDDFKVHINGTELTEKVALPDFAFKVGAPSAPVNDSIAVGDKRLAVRYWAGFVGVAQWPQDQAGVGVYAHGKIAQDRPFAFGRKGDEIYIRYMYAVVEADWLDELPDDLISTDRTTVDWAHPEAQALMAWGERRVKEWVSEYEKFRRESDRTKTVKRIREKKEYHLSDAETEALADLLTDISPSIGNDESTRDRAIEALSGAWVHMPMRDMTKKLWDALKAADGNAEQFIQTIEQLRKHLVPESLSLAVTFAQRIYALSVLFKRIHAGTETDLQRLIETFPWILRPEMEKLAANATLKRVIAEAEAAGFNTPVIDTSPASNMRPDFVYFSPPGEYDRIVVVELKNPGQQHHLTYQNELQLITYMRYIQARYPKAEVRGLLIGNNYMGLKTQQTNVEVLDWSEVLASSRKGHVEMLASMLVGAHPNINDTRVAQVAQFGGPEALELLQRLATNDEELQELMPGLQGR